MCLATKALRHEVFGYLFWVIGYLFSVMGYGLASICLATKTLSHEGFFLSHRRCRFSVIGYGLESVCLGTKVSVIGNVLSVLGFLFFVIC